MQLPLNVSPVSASFIGLQRQGILPVLFFACSSHSFSALGSIEVIMLFNCEGTPVMSLDNWKVENSEQC